MITRVRGRQGSEGEYLGHERFGELRGRRVVLSRVMDGGRRPIACACACACGSVVLIVALALAQRRAADRDHADGRAASLTPWPFLWR